MTKRQYMKLYGIQIHLVELCSSIEHTDSDKRLDYGNGFESDQLGCAIAALECILQEFRH